MSNTISRVEKEFIFNFIIKNKVKIEIKSSDGDTTEAFLLEQNAKEIKIELLFVPESLKTYNAEIKVFFYFQNTHHTFKTNIVKLQGVYAIIKNPDNLVRNLQRKFERILVNGKYSIGFEIQGEIIPLNYPTTKISYFPDKAPISADFSNINIEEILKKFKDKMNSIVSANRVRLIKNYTPQTIEEKLTIHYGKILYIGNSHTDLITKQIDNNFEIITKNDWINYEKEINKTDQVNLNKVLSNYLVEIAKKDIFSEVVIPILYRNYVVGLIYLINNHKNSNPIDPKIINYAYQFSRITSYSLKQSGYFKEEEGENEKFLIPIYDMSPGGLGLIVDDNIYEDKLLFGHNYKVVIHIENREIRALVKLVRKIQQLSKHIYGFMFLEIKKDDFEFLQKVLYKDHTANGGS